jgi:hypothetical protein
MELFPIKVNGETPPKRWGSAGFVSEPFIYIFGGIAQSTMFDDLWRLDMKRWAWERLDLGKAPDKRWGHSFSQINQTAVLFGGRSGSKPQDMGLLYYFPLRSHSNEWCLQKITGNNKPKKRCGFVCTEGPDDSLIIFGGHGGRARYYNDVWTLKQCGGTFVWEEIETVGQIPTKRSLGDGVFHNGKLYVVGGTDKKRIFADVCVLDWETKTWSITQNSLLGLCKHCVKMIPNSDSLIIFGGISRNAERGFLWEGPQEEFSDQAIGFNLETGDCFDVPKSQSLTCYRAGHSMFTVNEHTICLFGESKNMFGTNNVIKATFSRNYSNPISLQDALGEIQLLKRQMHSMAEQFKTLLIKTDKIAEWKSELQDHGQRSGSPESWNKR